MDAVCVCVCRSDGGDGVENDTENSGVLRMAGSAIGARDDNSSLSTVPICEYDSASLLSVSPTPTPSPSPVTLESICSAIQSRIRANVNPRLIARVFPDSAGLEGRRR
jgi:hypothetical protein